MLGNHLFINAKALLYACAFFKLQEETRIYKTAISIINEEINEQFLEDGAHFELSPMYHSLAMEDLLDLISISDQLPSNFPKEVILEKFEKGMLWLQTMIYNNEELAHFNDCANGIAPKFSKLVSYASKLGIILPNIDMPKFSYHQSSEFVVYKDSVYHLIADLGKVGPDYLPGHAHADTLSFELAVKGHRVIVNSGTSVYGSSKERLRQRGTSAHSTVQIDNQDSSEIWSGFRVARRAIPFNIDISPVDSDVKTIRFNASHNGYQRLKNEPIHKRSWFFNDNGWIIEDGVSGKKNQITARYYLHPDLQIESNENRYMISKSKRNLAAITFVNSIKSELIDSTYHDEFGVSRLNKCIQAKAISPCKLTIRIELL